MGDSKARMGGAGGGGRVGTTTISTTGTTTTTLITTPTTSRRMARYGSRSSANTSRNLESVRPPIVLEIGSSILRVGYAGSSSPAHLIPVTGPASTTVALNCTESEWYTLLSPWVEAVYDRLLCPPKTRKVLVVHTPLYVPQAWKAALEQLFWNQGAPAISFVSALEIIPMAQGWKRGLIVHVSQNETVCVCHSDGHLLPFTYQSIPECGYGHLMKDVNTLQRDWTPHMDYWLLDERHNPNSFTVALMKCLEACPRDLRYDVIYHLVVCGDGGLILPDMGRRIALRLEQILEGTQEELTVPAELVEASSSSTSTTTSMAAIPVPVAALKPLASRLRLLDSKPQRPDFLAWIGASLWAATWNRYDAEESRIEWKVAPKE